MNVLSSILNQARALIVKGYCQGMYAAYASGKEVPRLDMKGAVSYDAIGATIKVCEAYTSDEYRMAARYLLRVANKDVYSNSDESKESCLAMFDRAIALSEKEGG